MKQFYTQQIEGMKKMLEEIDKKLMARELPHSIVTETDGEKKIGRMFS